MGSGQSLFSDSEDSVSSRGADKENGDGSWKRTSEPVHLVVLVNGIGGSAQNWRFAAAQMQSKFGNDVLVHCSARNSSTLTFDGVDVMGGRLAEEVKEVINESPSLKRISFIAHSLGGLIARYAIGKLYDQPKSISLNDDNEENKEDNSAGTIHGLQPINFVTVATPHIGSRGNWQLPFLCGVTVLEKIAVSSAHLFIGKTGRHLFLTDATDGQRPLLMRMVTDCDEGQFISALQAFERRVAYANINFDHMVGWRTATFRRECELPELKLKPLDERYPHVIHVEEVPPEKDEPSDNRKPAMDTAEEVMISGLRRMPWQRVDVSFAGSMQCLASHNTIQVKYYWMHSDGVDVVSHIIDNFVL